MSNIFTQTKDFVQQPNRNAFDLSFQNNLTMGFGTLYPVFCKEVVPGDSFQIKPTFALRLLPMAFPIQTRMQANLHFFYVRNRNLWKNWTKFIGHTDNSVVAPYICPSKDTIGVSTGSLCDYLGVPTTINGNYGASIKTIGSDWLIKSDNLYSARTVSLKGNSTDYGKVLQTVLSDFNTDGNAFGIANIYNGALPFGEPFGTGVTLSIIPNSANVHNFHIAFAKDSVDSVNHSTIVAEFNGITAVDLGSEGGNTDKIYLNNKKYQLNLQSATSFNIGGKDYSFDISKSNYIDFSTAMARLNEVLSDSYDNHSYQYRLLIWQSVSWTDTVFYYNFNYPIHEQTAQAGYLLYVKSVFTPSEVADIDSINNGAYNPYSKQNNAIHLSALPFRAYESIYNAFYRNEQNDPLIIDGKPEYDKYCPNVDDGLDEYPYYMHYRNWEPDFLTSAVQSPQQGIAPLVGVSSKGDFTFVNKDDNGNVNYFTAKANVAADGNTITGFKLSDKVTLKGVDTSTTGDMSEIPDSVKRGTVYTLNQMALAGISINDFRNVNALQRWLETNIRRGYKYKEQLKSHFGVDAKFEELDMPEFIGGMSEPVYVNQVNQTVGTESEGSLGQPLGSYAGQGSVVASSNHEISHYCDEHGFIIGIISVTPVPNYSQILPKMFLKSNYLDYYFPEFGHIGMQPIDYREVCPNQVFANDGAKGLSQTFGYQRPWYDYIASVDEVHGLFRTQLRNFLMNRTFNSKPVLNHDFLKVDPSQLNDVFTVTDVTDKILGQIYFEVTAKRPIPRMGIPRLE